MLKSSFQVLFSTFVHQVVQDVCSHKSSSSSESDTWTILMAPHGSSGSTAVVGGIRSPQAPQINVAGNRTIRTQLRFGHSTSFNSPWFVD